MPRLIHSSICGPFLSTLTNIFPGKDPAEGEDKYAWIMRNAAYEEGSYEWELMRKEKECRNDSEFGLLVGMLTGQAFSMDEYWN